MEEKSPHEHLEMNCSTKLLCQDDLDVVRIFLYLLKEKKKKKQHEKIALYHKGDIWVNKFLPGHSSPGFISFYSETEGMACFSSSGVNSGGKF